MAGTPTVYVLCNSNCKYEGMTKEQILTAIAQAVNDGEISNIDTGFISTVKTINGTGLKFFYGKQNEYDTLTEDQKQDLFAIIKDDNTVANIARDLEAALATLDYFTTGAIPVAWATRADTANAASTATSAEFATLAAKATEATKAMSAETAKSATTATSATSATSATKLVNGSLTFGRELIYTAPSSSKGMEIRTTEGTKTGTVDLTNRFLVVEVSVYAANIYNNTYLGKYRTLPFCAVKETYSSVTFNNKYYLTIGADKIAFWVEGKNLKYQIVSGGTGDNADKYYISGIYEEY